MPTAARLFYNVHNYCGDGDRDHGPRRRRSRLRRLTPSIIRQHLCYINYNIVLVVVGTSKDDNLVFINTNITRHYNIICDRLCAR